MPCAKRVNKMIKDNAKGTEYEKEVNCAKKDEYFFRVTGSWGRQNHAVGVYSFCADHGPAMQNIDEWRKRYTVSRCYFNHIDVVEMVDGAEILAERKTDKHESAKYQMKRMFKTKKYAKFTREAWLGLTEDAWNEHVIEDVSSQ